MPPLTLPALSSRIFFNLPLHSNVSNKVIEAQCTSMLFFTVYSGSDPRLYFLPPLRPLVSAPRRCDVQTCKPSDGLFLVRSEHPKKDAHRERPSGAEGFFSGLALLSLFAPRVFHNSFAIRRFRTLSQKHPGGGCLFLPKLFGCSGTVLFLELSIGGP